MDLHCPAAPRRGRPPMHGLLRALREAQGPAPEGVQVLRVPSQGRYRMLCAPHQDGHHRGERELQGQGIHRLRQPYGLGQPLRHHRNEHRDTGRPVLQAGPHAPMVRGRDVHRAHPQGGPGQDHHAGLRASGRQLDPQLPGSRVGPLRADLARHDLDVGAGHLPLAREPARAGHAGEAVQAHDRPPDCEARPDAGHQQAGAPGRGRRAARDQRLRCPGPRELRGDRHRPHPVHAPEGALHSRRRQLALHLAPRDEVAAEGRLTDAALHTRLLAAGVRPAGDRQHCPVGRAVVAHPRG
mmetsp:Transcript_50998/g.131484  ORF Transcript_50998/g.131484 Transcript_50998/m.131484 type:complete len:297 (-) Transcript_50998:295-1185(-)